MKSVNTESCMIAALYFELPTKYYWDDQIKDEMGTECDIYGTEQICIQGFNGK